jgi:hypothetical protein
MRMMNIFKRKPKSAGENESFVSLLRAAQDDDDLRATLCGILRQPTFHRQSMLNTMAGSMSADGVKEEMIRAVTALTDDAVAEEALQLLKD